MVDTRETPTPSNTPGNRIGEGEYADAVAAQTRALWARSALIIDGVTGTNDLVGTVTPAIDAPYEAGMAFWLVPIADNNDAMTLDLGQGSEPLVRTDGNPVEEGDVLAGVLYPLLFDGTQFRIITLAAEQQATTAGISPSVEHRTASATVTIPVGATKLRAILQGGGGNGGSGKASGCTNGIGGNGGSGATLYKYLAGLTAGNSLILTVGAATGNTILASGTQTIVTLTAAGGTSGTDITTGGTGTPGNGGAVPTTGDLNIAGQRGYPLIGSSERRGASSLFGHGGTSGTTGAVGVAGTGYGSGGCGAFDDTGITKAGGAGAPGMAIFEWYP